MKNCVFCTNLGVATTITTTTSDEAFPFLCAQLGLSTSVGGGGGSPCALCRSCHSLWEEVSVLYSNMQGLLNLMARRVKQFKKNIDKGHKDKDGHGSRRRKRGRKRSHSPPPPPDEESMLGWWYPSSSDSKKKRKGEEIRKEVGGVDVESSETDHVGVGQVGEIKSRDNVPPEEVDADEEAQRSGEGWEMGFEDIKLFPEDSDEDDDDDNVEPSHDPLSLSTPTPSQPVNDHQTRTGSNNARQPDHDLSQNESKLSSAKGKCRKRKMEYRIKWTEKMEQEFLNFSRNGLSQGRGFETPTACEFYRCFLAQTGDCFRNVTLPKLSQRVRRLKNEYQLAVSWRDDNSHLDKEELKKGIRKICKHFPVLDEILSWK